MCKKEEKQHFDNINLSEGALIFDWTYSAQTGDQTEELCMDEIPCRK